MLSYYHTLFELFLWASRFPVHPCEVLCNPFWQHPLIVLYHTQLLNFSCEHPVFLFSHMHVKLFAPKYNIVQRIGSTIRSFKTFLVSTEFSVPPMWSSLQPLWHYPTNLLYHTLIQNIPVSIQFSCPPMWSSLQHVMTSSNQFALPYPHTKHPSEHPVFLSTHVKFFATHYDIIQPICLTYPDAKHPSEHPIFLSTHVKLFATHYDIIQPICFTTPWYKTSQWGSTFLVHSCEVLCNPLWHHPTNLLYHTLIQNIPVSIQFSSPPMWSSLQLIMTSCNQFAWPYPDTKHPSEHPVFLSTHVKFFATHYDIIQPICFAIPWYKTSQWTSSSLVHPCEVLYNLLWHPTNLLCHTLIQNIPVSIQFSCPPMWSSLQLIMISANQSA